MSEMNPVGKIKINKLVSTIILGTSFSMILLFGLIFYMYFDTKSGYTSALKEAFSISAGFFGGVTTLVAAYVAAKLVQEWRNQELFNHKRKLYEAGIEKLREFSVLLNNLKHTYNPLNIDRSKRLELIEMSVKASQDLMISYKSDYMKAVEDDDNLIQIYDLSANFYEFVKYLLVDLNNDIHLITIQNFETQFATDVDNFINSLT